ncbi:MAG: hypothetical protein ACYCZ6_13095 [Polaromonas sp.]
MPVTDSSLSLGAPRFSDASLARLDHAQGPLVAWRETLGKDAAGAAASVSGDFAVALRLTDGSSFLAVDRFAIHSLCYRVDNRQLRFAARADELADASTRIDPQTILSACTFAPLCRRVLPTVFAEKVNAKC